MDAKEKARTAIVMMFFALICFVSSCVMGTSVGKKIQVNLDQSGGLVGPIKVEKNMSVYSVWVKQDMNYGNWSFVQGEVLDANKEYLFSFGGEFWAETGYDSDGSWSEKDTSFDISLTFPKKGTYYLKFITESSNSAAVRNVQVAVKRKMGSSLGFTVMGILSLIIGVVLYEFSSGGAVRKAVAAGLKD